MGYIILLWLTIITIFQFIDRRNLNKEIHDLKERLLKLEWTKDNN